MSFFKKLGIGITLASILYTGCCLVGGRKVNPIAVPNTTTEFRVGQLEDRIATISVPASNGVDPNLFDIVMLDDDSLYPANLELPQGAVGDIYEVKGPIILLKEPMIVTIPITSDILQKDIDNENFVIAYFNKDYWQPITQNLEFMIKDGKAVAVSFKTYHLSYFSLFRTLGHLFTSIPPMELNYSLPDNKLYTVSGTSSVQNLNRVIFIHGWNSDSTTWYPLLRKMTEHDFCRTQVQVFEYNPGLPIRENAQILKDLISNSYGNDPEQTPVNMLVGHSMGGLIARVYLQQLNPDPNIKELIMIGTPNHGSNLANILTHIKNPLPPNDVNLEDITLDMQEGIHAATLLVDGAGDSAIDLSPNSPIILELNENFQGPPIGIKYTVVAGTKVSFPAQFAHEMGFIDYLFPEFVDGQADEAVTVESARLPGADLITLNSSHRELLLQDMVLEIIRSKLNSPALTPLGFNEFGCQEFRREKDGAVMVKIPAGTYVIGPIQSTATVDRFFVQALPTTPEHTEGQNFPYEDWAYFEILKKEISITQFASGRTDPKSVTLPAFLIDKYETTREKYEAYCAMTGNPMPPVEIPSRNPNSEYDFDRRTTVRLGKVNRGNHYRQKKIGEIVLGQAANFQPISGNHPITNLSFAEAESYAAWLGGALPSDEQWEVAYRAGTTSVFFWGDDLARASTYCWHDTQVGLFRTHYTDNPENPFYVNGNADDQVYVGNAMGQIHQVGMKLPNGFGLFDMSGNAEEWCVVVDSSQNLGSGYIAGRSFGFPAAAFSGEYVRNPRHVTSTQTGLRVIIPLCKHE